MANLTYTMHDVQIAEIEQSTPLLGLLTGAPNADGTGVVEPSVNYGYARQPITFGPTVRDAVNSRSIISNTNGIIFGPVATQDWPAVSYIGIFSTAGVLLAYSPMASTRVAPVGDSISFGAAAVQLRFN